MKFNCKYYNLIVNIATQFLILNLEFIIADEFFSEDEIK